MDDKRGTRAKIPPQSRMLIITHALEQRYMQRGELAKLLQNELREKGFDVPEKEVLERMISKYRKHALNPVDRYWSLASLDEYPLPLEVLPIIMAFQETGRLTIRGAKWATRLYKLIPPELVLDWVWLYTLREIASEIQGQPFNSAEIDSEMMDNPYYAYEERRAIFIFRIAEEYGVDPYKLKELNLSVEETEEAVKANPEKFITKEKFYLSDYSKESVKLIHKLKEADEAKKNRQSQLRKRKGGNKNERFNQAEK